MHEVNHRDRRLVGAGNRILRFLRVPEESEEKVPTKERQGERKGVKGRAREVAAGRETQGILPGGTFSLGNPLPRDTFAK